MKERVVVIGAGMAGLFAALALAPTGRQITLLERDPPPPESLEQAFLNWNRRGVGQLRHSHAFLARLQNIVRAHHPELIEALLEAGCREIGLAEVLPAGLRAHYEPQPADREMAVLTSRRTTLEWVMRRYVEALPQVTVIPDVFVQALIFDSRPSDPLAVVGVRGVLAGEARAWRADVTIDAGGRGSQAFEQLIQAGARLSEQAEACGIIYYTRHYRLRPGCEEPRGNATPSTGDLDFIKYGVFPGDNRCFSITLALPEIETELRQVIVRPEIFDRICAVLPGVAPWTDARAAEPISKVFGMGDLSSRWRNYVAQDQCAVTGFFAVGDSLIRTNPLYGRGCSFAAIETEILADVLEATADPGARARLYEFQVRAALAGAYETLRDQDRSAIRRAARARHGGPALSVRQKLRNGFIQDGVRVAVRSDVELLRAALRDFHMIAPPGDWLTRPETLAKAVGWWVRGKRLNAQHYPSLGPERSAFLERLAITPANEPLKMAG